MGNPHQLGQEPLTFNRQVLALCAAPFLMDHPRVGDMFPKDAIARARQMHGYLNGGIGAYSDSRGAMGIRQEVADYISKRDGCGRVGPEGLEQLAAPTHRPARNHHRRSHAIGISVSWGMGSWGTCRVLVAHSPSPPRRHPCTPGNLFLTDGASPGVRMCLNALIRDDRDSILVPVPQYPLYSASIALYNGSFTGYYLDEDNNWGLSIPKLQARSG